MKKKIDFFIQCYFYKPGKTHLKKKKKKEKNVKMCMLNDLISNHLINIFEILFYTNDRKFN